MSSAIHTTGPRLRAARISAKPVAAGISASRAAAISWSAPVASPPPSAASREGMPNARALLSAVIWGNSSASARRRFASTPCGAGEAGKASSRSGDPSMGDDPRAGFFWKTRRRGYVHGLFLLGQFASLILQNEGWPFWASVPVTGADGDFVMRAAILASGIILGLASASTAMPLAFLPTSPNTLQAHGCHHYYAHDMSGWHRHDKECRTLRGTVGRKSRNPAKS